MNNDQEFLQHMSVADKLIDHQDGCGHCAHQVIMAQVARELLERGDGTIEEWSIEAKKRWQEGKYFKLYQEEIAAGRNPEEAFNEKGWEM
jgi:hypothetical protein